MPYRLNSRFSRRGFGALTLPQAIFRQEGSTDAAGNWNTSSLGYRLNNPGNLNYAGQPGCHPTTMGNGMEAQCDTLDAGIAATSNQLALDASRGLTLAQRLQTWATGNPSAYVANVSNWMGVDPNTPLSAILAGDTGSGTMPVDPTATVVPPVVDTGSAGSIDPTTGLPLDAAGSTSSLSSSAWLGIGIGAAALALWAMG